MATIPKGTVSAVRARAQHRCEYCRTSEWLSGQRHEVDHIILRILHGATALANLCLACAMCNGFKGDRIAVEDPTTHERVALFNPRAQMWREHFAWSEDGLRIIGSTPCGRGTVAALRMNQPLVAAARSVWVSANRHPPDN